MLVEVAIGEIFDKITILDIKLERIPDETRLSYVRGEKEILENALVSEGVKIDPDLYDEALSRLATLIRDAHASQSSSSQSSQT